MKGIAFIIICLCLANSITIVAQLLLATNGGSNLFAQDYITSNEADMITNNVLHQLTQINEDDQQTIDNRLFYLKQQKGIYFYTKIGDKVYTNYNFGTQDEVEIINFFKQSKYFYIYQNNNTSTTIPYYENRLGTTNPIYFCFDNQFIEERTMALHDNQRLLEKNFLNFIVSFILGLLAFIYLLFVCGRDSSKKLKLMTIDRLYTDVNFTLLITLFFAYVIPFITLTDELINSSQISFNDYIYTTFFIITALFTALGLAFLFSLVRHTKNKTLLKHSLINTIINKSFGFVTFIFRKIKEVFKTLFTVTNLSVKVVGSILVCEFIVFILSIFFIDNEGFFLPMLIIFTIVIPYIVMKFIVNPFNEIQKGVQKIKDGDLNYIITPKVAGEMGRLANSINTLSDGLKNSVAKEMKAEKLKTELITNVSHDLKTPLTSIINYADLLSNEELTPDFANEYVTILKQKSEKLKHLTEDLFEISKAQSGNIQTNIEKLDVKELIDQTIAEFLERIEESKFDFKLNIEDCHIMADGKLMSRVFENLIGNILKYSMDGTRVYIDIQNKNNNVEISFKNIANYEMNFSDDEILERFQRADKARATEGNGLGLAIAKSYTEACNGKLKIKVDGDLFKITLIF